MVFCIRKKRALSYDYLSVLISFVIFFILYAAPILNLPRILESYRLIICLYSTAFPLLCIGLDLAFPILEEKLLAKFKA